MKGYGRASQALRGLEGSENLVSSAWLGLRGMCPVKKKSVLFCFVLFFNTSFLNLCGKGIQGFSAQNNIVHGPGQLSTASP